MPPKSPPGVLAFILAIIACASASPAQTPATRADFAKALATIHEGMTAAQVEAAVGKPDDIATSADPGRDFTRNAETWAYGTTGGHLSFPTLGSVRMLDGKVREIRGGGGTLPDPEIFQEAGLRKLLCIIDATGSNNPIDLIRAVNTLQPLGKEKALAAIDEYLRVDSDHGYFEATGNLGVYLTLRLLFEVPEDPGYFPPMQVGGPDPRAPQDPKILPRFPLALIDDIPLNLVFGYMLAGAPGSARDYVEYFRKSGVLRKQPLHPGGDPLGVLATLRASPQWVYGTPEHKEEYERGESYVANQILALVTSVYWTEHDFSGNRFRGDRFDPANWDQMTKTFSQLHVKWDAEKNSYTFADGTTLPEVKTPQYTRIIWDLPFLKPGGRFILERLDKKWVRAVLWNQGENDQPAGKATIRLYKPWDHDHPLVQIDVHHGESLDEFEYYAGLPIDVEAVAGKKTYEQPKMVP